VPKVTVNKQLLIDSGSSTKSANNWLSNKCVTLGDHDAASSMATSLSRINEVETDITQDQLHSTWVLAHQLNVERCDARMTASSSEVWGQVSLCMSVCTYVRMCQTCLCAFIVSILRKIKNVFCLHDINKINERKDLEERRRIQNLITIRFRLSELE